MNHNLRSLIRLKKILWRIIASILIVIAIAVIVVFAGYKRKNVMAYIDKADYMKKPFRILEVVPYKGQGQWGYLVKGEEPVKVSDINAYYQSDTEREQFWENTFQYDFAPTGLLHEKGALEYKNENYFINYILGRDNEEIKSWWLDDSERKKVEVNSVSACELTPSMIYEADLLILQSDKTANVPGDSYTTSLHQLYDRYVDHGKASFYHADGSEISLSGFKDKEYVGYDSFVQYEGENKKISLDISWDNAEAILYRAFHENKATIVSSGETDWYGTGYLTRNMDKLVFLLCYLTKDTYSIVRGTDPQQECGFMQFIEKSNDLDTVLLDGNVAWDVNYMTQKLLNRGFLIQIDYWQQDFGNLKYYSDIPAEVKDFILRFGTAVNLSAKEFYEQFDDSDWESLVAYAKKLENAGKITTEQYQRIVLWSERYSLHQIWYVQRINEIGYETLFGSMRYQVDTDVDNVIRYKYWGEYPFLPENFVQEGSSYLSDIHAILNGVVLNNTIKYDYIRVLEIEPTNHYWLTVSNESKLWQALGLDGTKYKFQTTYVTPNRLNGMTVDLCADYDLILVGDDVSGFSENSRYRNGGEPYYHTGYHADTLQTSALINGLLDDDFTTMKRIADLKGYAAVYLSDLNEDSSVLKNLAIERELNQNMSKMRFSGNDITDYMQNQLAGYVNSGRPVILLNSMYDHVNTGIRDFNEFENNEQAGGDRQKNADNESYEQYMDANLYFALAGIADEESVLTNSNPKIRLLGESNYLSNVYKNDVLDGSNTVALATPDIRITIGEKNSLSDVELDSTMSSTSTQATIVEAAGFDKEKPDLSKLKPVNVLSFDYSIKLPEGVNASSYEAWVVIDRNGDGIFDLNGEQASTDGTTSAAGESSKTIQNDLVYSLENQNPISGNAFKGTFTSNKLDALEEVYQFRVIVKEVDSCDCAVWTGYVRPNTKKGRAVKILQITPNDEDGGDNRSKWMKYFNEAGGEFILQNKDDVQVTTEADFSAGFAASADSESMADQLHNTYDLIIVGTDFSAEASRGYSDLEENAARILRTYVEKQYPVIFTNDTISYVNTQNYMTYKAEQCWWPYGWYYSRIDVAGSENALYPKQNNWNYQMTRYLRDSLGMDRFGITLTESEKTVKQRDPGTTRRWAKTDEARKKELQGFTNAALIEFADTSGNMQSYFASGTVGISIPSSPRTSRIRALNDGAITSYPYRIGEKKDDLVKVKQSHAPYYQLYLERSLNKNQTGSGGSNESVDYEDVTVWYTLEAPAITPDDSYSAYFKVTSGDAGNNYYLYSKGKTYYTGFSMYGGSPSEAELKLFVNTIYAALNSEAESETETTSSTYSAVVETNALIQQYGELSSTAAVPNRYLCYYMEGELKQALQTIQYEITNQSASGQTISVEISRKNQAATSSDAQVSQTVSGVVIGNRNDLSMSNTGPYTDNMDGLTLVIRPVPASSGPDQICINAEITFVKKELFDLD